MPYEYHGVLYNAMILIWRYIKQREMREFFSKRSSWARFLLQFPIPQCNYACNMQIMHYAFNNSLFLPFSPPLVLGRGFKVPFRIFWDIKLI